MFCNKCGKAVDENANFCVNCGNTLKQPIIEENQLYDFPSIEQNYTVNNSRLAISFSQYIKQYADIKTKKFIIFERVFSIVYIILLIASVFITYFGLSVLKDIHLTRVYLIDKYDDFYITDDGSERYVNLSYAELTAYDSNLEIEYEYMDSEFDNYMSDDYKQSIEEFTGVDYDTAINIRKNFAKTPSLYNAIKAYEVYGDTVFLESYEKYDLEETLNVFKIGSYVSLGIFLIGLVLSIFGIIYNNLTLIISGFIVLIILAIAVSSIILCLLISAAFLSVAILLSKAKKKYKEFQICLN